MGYTPRLAEGRGDHYPLPNPSVTLHKCQVLGQVKGFPSAAKLFLQLGEVAGGLAEWVVQGQAPSCTFLRSSATAGEERSFWVVRPAQGTGQGWAGDLL